MGGWAPAAFPLHSYPFLKILLLPLPHLHRMYPVSTTYRSYEMSDNVIIQSPCFTSKINFIGPSHGGDRGMIPASFPVHSHRFLMILLLPLPHLHRMYPITKTYRSYKMSDNVLIQPPRFTSKISLISPSHGGDRGMVPSIVPLPRFVDTSIKDLPHLISPWS